MPASLRLRIKRLEEQTIKTSKKGRIHWRSTLDTRRPKYSNFQRRGMPLSPSLQVHVGTVVQQRQVKCVRGKVEEIAEKVGEKHIHSEEQSIFRWSWSYSVWSCWGDVQDFSACKCALAIKNYLEIIVFFLGKKKTTIFVIFLESQQILPVFQVAANLCIMWS